MNICVIAGTYKLSGVPLAQLKLAKVLSNLGHTVELIYGDVVEGYQLPKSSKYKIKCFYKKRVKYILFDLIRLFKKNKFDIIFSAGDHLNIIVLISAIISKSKAKISCSSRVTPYDVYSKKIFSKGWIMKILMKLLLNKADVLSCVSKEMVDQYREVLGSNKHVCIYNIVKDSESCLLMNETVNEKWLIEKKEPVIIAAGALEKWKGFEDLIHGFNLLLKHKKAKLIILGEGSLYNHLNTLINRLNIEEHVLLKGNVNNPLKYFNKADVFALSSHVEGMPNVLIEAMMAGCTPVATDCKTGPREILKDSSFGYLVKVGDPISISDGLLQAINKPVSKAKLNIIVEFFSEKKIINQHFDYLGIK